MLAPDDNRVRLSSCSQPLRRTAGALVQVGDDLRSAMVEVEKNTQGCGEGPRHDADIESLKPYAEARQGQIFAFTVCLAAHR